MSAIELLGRSWWFQVGAFVLGTLIGSFLNVVIARLPAGLSIVRPGSRCPKCETPIRPHHNVPVLSWLLLRAQCAYCGTPISVRYPAIEIVTGALFAACAARFGLQWSLIAAWSFTGALVAVTFIDLDTWEIPDEIVVAGLPFALILRWAAFDAPWWSGVVGALLGAAFLLMVRWVFFALRGVEAMGLGDVKLLAFIGAFLGPGALVPTICVASVAGTVVGALLLAFHRDPQQEDPETSETPEDADEAWAEPPKRVRLGAWIRGRGRRATLGVPRDLWGRTHVRLGFMMGGRGRRGRSGWELGLGLFQDVPGWGHFEGWVLSPGGRPRFWIGPLVGARLADVEAFGDEEDWTPPPTALPFGPFLALGALGTMLLAPLLGSWSRLLGL